VIVSAVAARVPSRYVLMVLEAEVSPVSSPDAFRGVCLVVRQRGGSDDGHDGELA
jgi:hypothetical protein